MKRDRFRPQKAPFVMQPEIVKAASALWSLAGQPLRALSVALALCATACVGSSSNNGGASADDHPGGIVLALALAPGTALGAVSYVVTGPAAFSKSGTIDVSGSSSISALLGPLPAGPGYTITLSAAAVDGGPSCSGSAMFDVAAHGTTPVTVHLLCHEAGRTGSVLVSGSLNVCPVIDGLGASPLALNVGASTRLVAAAHDADAAPAPLTYQWAAPGGLLTNASSSTATFACQTEGNFLVNVVVGDGDPTPGCTDTASLTVMCTPLVCPGGCDDGNACTTDTCDEHLTCLHTPIADGPLCQGGNLHVKLLGLNDFHGQLSAGKAVSGRPVGSAGVLAAYLERAQAGLESQTLIVHAGDHVGASPASSALLQDEPSVSFLNLLANEACSTTDKMNPACNLVGTLGNHEFDEGKGELLRLLDGGNFPGGPFLEDPYRGARFPYVSANVVDEITHQPILPPFVVKVVHGVPIAFIGAVLKDTPTIVTPTGVAGLAFLDEADTANSYVPALKAAGVRAMVLLIHQGGSQSSYTGPTNTSRPTVNGPEILDIVNRLDSEFDVVVSGHSHAFTNAVVPNAAGKPILVTQAFSAGTAYDDIDLFLDPISHDVVSKSAQIVTTFADAGPGLMPDPGALALTAQAEMLVGPKVSQVEGVAPRSFTRTQNAAGESELGDLIADAQRASLGTQFCAMNPGGIRADLVVPAGGGPFTWNDLFTIQPFGNTMVQMQLTGAQIKQALEQQWTATTTRILSISGLAYTWDASQPIGSRVTEVRDAASNAVLVPAATYSMTVNNFLSTGGDGFTAFVGGQNKVGGPVDLDALIEYAHHNDPLPVPAGGRITRLN